MQQRTEPKAAETNAEAEDGSGGVRQLLGLKGAKEATGEEVRRAGELLLPRASASSTPALLLAPPTAPTDGATLIFESPADRKRPWCESRDRVRPYSSSTGRSDSS